MFQISSNTRLSYLYLLKWMFLALVAGVSGSLLTHSFTYLLFMANRSFLISPIPLPAVSLLGALFTAGLIYRIEPRATGEGLPSYIRGIRFHGGMLPFSETLAKYPAGLATLGTFGNGGVVGPVGRVSAGLMSFMCGRLRRLGFTDDDVRTATICGVAATVGTMFRTPIGGGIFAVEIIQRRSMGYRDLFPAILASSIAVLLSRALKLPSYYLIGGIRGNMEFNMIGWVLLMAVLTGLAGGLFTRLYEYIARAFKREEGKILLKAVSGSLVASAIAWAINPELLGTSSIFLTNLSTGNLQALTGRLSASLPLVLVLPAMILCKALCNCITVGSGMSAGFTMPAIIVGMLLGATVATALRIDPGSPAYYALVATGYSGILASSMNIPIAAAVMGVEVFGVHYSVPVTLAAIIGFQINRHQTVYDFAMSGRDIEPLIKKVAG
jgi:CIC family chloride channel protein